MPAVERALAGGGDRRAVGERIAVRNARVRSGRRSGEIASITAAVVCRIGIAGDEIDDQRRAAFALALREHRGERARVRDHACTALRASSAATVRVSLSPRPLRFTSTSPSGPRSGASRARERDRVRASRAPARCLRCAPSRDTLRALRRRRPRRRSRGPLSLRKRMLGTDARIIEAGADRMRVAHLPLGRLQHVRTRAVQDADACRH